VYNQKYILVDDGCLPEGGTCSSNIWDIEGKIFS